MLSEGVYEQVISRGLRKSLDGLPRDFSVDIRKVDKAEASKVLTHYAAMVIEQALREAGEGKDGLEQQVHLVNSIVAAARGDADATPFEVEDDARQLLSLVNNKNTVHVLSDGKASGKITLLRPDTSVAESSLFTGAAREPQLYVELGKEIASADRIDFLVSFIKWSGLRGILNELKAFADRGGRLRVITTSYIGATDPRAVEELSQLPGAEVRVSYDTKRTRLHAKSYVFYRNTGFSTAYVGSSNISAPAMSSGLEWNVKVAGKDLPDVMEKIAATFETYWNSSEFEKYDESQRKRFAQAIAAERHGAENGGGDGHADGSVPMVLDVRPYPFQQQILDALIAEREVHNRWRNLVVAATGTGKTVISAFDYKWFCDRYNGGRHAHLLFVVHREEILKQSLSTFRGVLHDANFGEMMVGDHHPKSLEHLFASVQSLNSRGITRGVSEDYYDYIVIDEFHHAEAPTYTSLLEHFRPAVLLGLTATPERMDGKSIMPWFDGGRPAAEIRLPEAIDRKLLCPFQYFGVSDEVDLSELRWSRGGYEQSALENVYVFSQRVAVRRAHDIARAVRRYVADIDEVKGLGFCVSVKHAEFMAGQFNSLGIPSLAVTGQTPEDVRTDAKRRLRRGELRFVFTVDVYNEGVDIPEVNTVLFLRPTQSLTVFLQQLGRGLRLSEDKECLTVLDFIGQANRRYDFESKFAAMLDDPSRDVRREIETGFVSVPKGCFVQLERKAQEYVLDNIRHAYGGKSGMEMRIRNYAGQGKPLTLASFLDDTHMDIRRVYATGSSFARLCARAGVREGFNDPDEKELTKALARVCSIDSRRWITFLLDALAGRLVEFSALQMRMLKMFQVTVWPGSLPGSRGAVTFKTPVHAIARILANPVLSEEIVNVLSYNLDHLDFVDEPVDMGFECPLDLHCRYTHDQIFVAMDLDDPSSVRQGVRWMKDKNVDVLINTLDKSERDYSPSTMYKDYAIDEWHFHWESQSTISAESKTGQRYIHHDEWGSKVALFVREANTDLCGTSPFTFLGLAHYVSHEGSRPMGIVWRLERPIPAKYLRATLRLAG